MSSFDDRRDVAAASIVTTHDRVEDAIRRLRDAADRWKSTKQKAKAPTPEELATIRDRVANLEASVSRDVVWRDIVSARGTTPKFGGATAISDAASAAAVCASLKPLAAPTSTTEVFEGLRRCALADSLDAPLLRAYVTEAADRLRRIGRAHELRERVPRAYVESCWKSAIPAVRKLEQLDMANVGPELLRAIADDAAWAQEHPGEHARTLEESLRWTIEISGMNNALDHVALQLAYAPRLLGSSPATRAFEAVARRAIRIALGMRCAMTTRFPAVAHEIEAAFVAAGVARAQYPEESAHGVRRRRYARAATWGAIAALEIAAGTQLASRSGALAEAFERAVAEGLADGSIERAEVGRLTTLRTIFLDAVPSLFEVVQSAIGGSVPLDAEPCWREMPRALAGPPLLGWEDQLPDHPVVRDRARGVDAIVDSLKVTPIVHHVFRRIEGVERGGRDWKFGDIEFFDASERRAAFDSFLSRSGSAVLARIPVLAGGPTEAEYLADVKLGVALDVITYGLTAFKDHGGLCPTVIGHVAIVTSDGRSLGGGSTRKHERSPRPVKGDDVPELLDDYAQVTAAWAQGTTHRLAGLEARVRAALAWYRRARWQPDLTRRTLEYWIALEHFFVDGKKQKKANAPRRAAMMHVTWRDLPETHHYVQLWDRAVRLARRDHALAATLDADPALENWATDAGILLDLTRVTRFADAISGVAGPALGPLLEDAVKELLANEVALHKLINLTRWDVQLVLERVQAARNDIVHEAESLAGYERRVAEILEQVVEDAILKVLQHVLDPNAVDDTIEAVVRRCHAPLAPPSPF